MICFQWYLVREYHGWDSYRNWTGNRTERWIMEWKLDKRCLKGKSNSELEKKIGQLGLVEKYSEANQHLPWFIELLKKKRRGWRRGTKTKIRRSRRKSSRRISYWQNICYPQDAPVHNNSWSWIKSDWIQRGLIGMALIKAEYLLMFLLLLLIR